MGVADLEGVGERGRQRDRRRRGRWTRVKAQVVVRCHGSLQSQETDAGQPWEAGGTAKRAVSHTGSGRGLSPMMCSLTPETNLTNGHTAPMRGRSRRPTVSKAEEHRAPGAAPVPSTCEAAQPPRRLTLMRPPVVKRQTTPRSGFFAFFRFFSGAVVTWQCVLT